ncbi:MAG: hypothetical protein GY906_19955 [bacterium]|nr:hypothetical protein [bacterium]
MLKSVFSQHRDTLLERWTQRILDGYPDETAKFLSKQKDQFANPVGSGLRSEVGQIFDGIVNQDDPEVLLESLDRVIRVRAVQDFSPAGAVAFILELKPLAREVVGEEEHRAVLEEFDCAVDRVLLAAFDVYSRCREQMFEIRVDAIRRQSITVIERLNEWRAGRAGGEDEAANDSPSSYSSEETVTST